MLNAVIKFSLLYRALVVVEQFEAKLITGTHDIDSLFSAASKMRPRRGAKR